MKKNHFSKIILSSLLLFSLSQPVFSAETINKNEINQVLNTYEGKKLNDFKGFLNSVKKSSNSKNLKNSIDTYLNNNIDDKNDWINIYRMLGIYTRVKYKGLLLDTLERLVAIPTDKKEDKAQYLNPNIKSFGVEIEKIAKSFGLDFRNVDNRIFEVTLKGSSEEDFGVYTHGDVVPADPSKWILEDGTKLDPYQMQIIGDKIYGRGTEDDKCSIVVTLVAMKVIKDLGIDLKRSIRLIIETTEETGGEGFEYYKKQGFPLPAYNIVLDSSYPIVTAEKGFGVTSAFFPVDNIVKGNTITDMTSGLAYNQIPSLSKATIYSENPVALQRVVETYANKFISNNGDNFSIMSEIKENNLIVTLKGVSAHSSEPKYGVNPVSRMAKFLNMLNEEIGFHSNHYTDAVKYISDNFGLDYLGKTLGIDYSNDFMGPLTVSVTYLKIKGDKLEVSVNTRAPKGKEPNQLISEITQKIKKYQSDNDMDFSLNVTSGNYMYRNPKGEWINTLLNIFGEVTGKESKAVSSSGGTTAKQLPNGVSFGPSMPNEKYMGHNANEFKKISNYLFDVQMFTEMFLRIGNLENME